VLILRQVVANAHRKNHVPVTQPRDELDPDLSAIDGWKGTHRLKDGAAT